MIFCDKGRLKMEGDTHNITAELTRVMDEMISDIVKQTGDPYEKVLEYIITVIVKTLQKNHNKESETGGNI